IYRTDDAGQTWNIQSIENNLNKVKYIQFATSRFGYALNEELSSQNQITKTLLTTEQTPATPLSVKFFDFNNQFTVFPNPANDFIHIQNNSDLSIQYIHLIDMNGKIIRTFENNLQSLNVSDISAGNYILLLQTTQQRIAKKIV